MLTVLTSTSVGTLSGTGAKLRIALTPLRTRRSTTGCAESAGGATMAMSLGSFLESTSRGLKLRLFEKSEVYRQPPNGAVRDLPHCELFHNCGPRRKSAAAIKSAAGVCSGLHGLDKRNHDIQPILLKCVIHALSVSAAADEAGILQHFQMKGEERLRDVEHLFEFAHATILVRKHLDDVDPGDIGQRMKPQRHVRQLAGQ